jgi:exosortase A-associated hydrolase 2
VAQARGALVYLHPFAEEMNKSRHLVAAMARAFAASGWHVLQIDLHGCGDSAGEFVDATWDSWLQDVEVVMGLAKQLAVPEVWLWGLRAGGLLAADWAGRKGDPQSLLLWHPVLKGAQHLQQFLRIRTMRSVSQGAEAESVKSLRQLFETEGSIEVGGYEVSRRLASGLEQSDLVEVMPKGSRIRWLEIGNREPPALGPASTVAIERLQTRGCAVEADAVAGPSFWQSVELEDAPALLAATARLFRR